MNRPHAERELARASEDAGSDDLEAALARVDRLVETTDAATPARLDALRAQHDLRRRLCWLAGVLDPLAARLDPPRARDTAWREEARRLVGHYARQLDADRAITLLDAVAPAGTPRELERVAILVHARRFADAARWAARELSGGAFDGDEALRFARLCLEAGDAALARRFGEAAIERGHDAPRALAFAGTLALWSGDVDRASALARRAFTAAVAAEDRAAALKLSGQAALVRGDARASAALLERAAAAAPPDYETSVLLAEARRKLGDRSAARGALDRARAKGQSYSFAYEANDILLAGHIGPAVVNRLDLIEGLGALGLTTRSWRGQPRPDQRQKRPAALLEAALERLSGNRSDVLTRAAEAPAREPPASFRCVRPGPGVRAACVLAREALPRAGFDGVIADHEALLAQFGHSPLVYSHRGELLLWAGRYDEAARDFETALRLHRGTRWAWAGLGACHLLRGSPRLALAALFVGRFNVMPALTTHVYAAEAWLALGDDRRALAELQKARELHPRRASIYLGFAIAAARAGRREEANGHLHTLRGLAPGFFRALLRDTGVDDAGLRRDASRARDVAARGLEMMRGNRSSGMLTWFDASGRAYIEAGAAPAARDPREA